MSAAASKTERLMNLVLVLLYTRRPLQKAAIRASVQAYREAPTDEAFDRMFERDKDELRALGIPLVTQDADPLFDDEPGYRIPARDYALPEIDFQPDELAVLGLAARTWAHDAQSSLAADAMRKLEAAGVERDPDALVGIEPRLLAAEGAFAAVKSAILTLTPISFTYHRLGTGEAQLRHLQPWGLTSRRGHWYVTGLDTDRKEPRVFRLSRIVGDVVRSGSPGSYAVPEGHRPSDLLTALRPEGSRRVARVVVQPGRGHALRRRQVADPWADGDTKIAITFVDLDTAAADLAGYGPDAVVESPQDLREAVIARLQGAVDSVASAHG